MTRTHSFLLLLQESKEQITLTNLVKHIYIQMKNKKLKLLLLQAPKRLNDATLKNKTEMM